MLRSICNRKGITLIESVIAVLILSIGLVGLLAMQPQAWKMTARTDYLGRAAMMLSKELTARELDIMNPCNNPVDTTPADRTLFTSGQGAAQSGDIAFRVVTTTTSVGTNVWRVTVQVSWPPLNPTGIRESIIVTSQETFRVGGCL
jgi:Tfp pilus assembly protein PilV